MEKNRIIKNSAHRKSLLLGLLSVVQSAAHKVGIKEYTYAPIKNHLNTGFHIYVDIENTKDDQIIECYGFLVEVQKTKYMDIVTEFEKIKEENLKGNNI